MMRLFKFLLGLSIGAAAGVLLAPKSGRELREQLLGGAAGRLLPPVAEHYPLGEDEPFATPAAPPVSPVGEASSESAPAAETSEQAVWVDETTIEELMVFESEPELGLEGEEPAGTVIIAETIVIAGEELTPEDEITAEAVPEEPEVPPAEAVEPLAEAVEPEAVEPPAEPEPASEAEELIPEEPAVAAEAIMVEAAEEAVVAGPEAEELVPEEPAVVEEPVVIEAAEEVVVAEAEAFVAEDAEAGPSETVIEPPAAVGEDLLSRIEATRAAVAADLAEPFSSAPAAVGAPGETDLELLPEASVEPEPVVEGAELEAWQAGESSPETTAEEPLESPAASSAGAEEPPVGWIRDGQGLVADIIVSRNPVEPSIVAEEPAPAEEPARPEEPISFREPERVEEPPSFVYPVVSPAQVVEEPVPAAEPAAAETRPPVETPTREAGAVDQAEMRRRIEETRARLKAKAFDAMMSGESALLRNDAGIRPVPSETGTELEPDVDSTIDQSLSQEDL